MWHGFSAQTNQVYQPAVGANARGDVDALNTLFVANTDGSATLSVGLQNNLEEAQQLSSVEVTTFEGEPLVVRSPKILLPLEPNELTTLGNVKGSVVFLVSEGAEAGDYVKVTFTFTDSAPLTVEAPVVARNAEYDSVAGSASAQ
ncbi:hypothetical protein [Aeromicrobium sp. UC242_57]|uniref:hypothetical protein n=1 Tax=Aeromicrobium sp. UC242_57 TaxID=3374624 RepID=UPI0037B47306